MKSGTTTKKAATSRGTAVKPAGSNRSLAGKQGSSNTVSDPEKESAPAAQQKHTAEKTKQTPFEKLFEALLKDIYWAEQHLVKSLPKMIDATTTEGLKGAFENHLKATKQHVKRLEQVFSLLGKPAQAVKCPVMEALVKEAEEVIDETPENSMTRDAGLIIAAQKVEHYEIASYGSLVQVALTLEHYRVADLLEATLLEEEDTDRELTLIAESEINPIADEEGEDNSEEGTEEEEENA